MLDVTPVIEAVISHPQVRAITRSLSSPGRRGGWRCQGERHQVAATLLLDGGGSVNTKLEMRRNLRSNRSKWQERTGRRALWAPLGPAPGRSGRRRGHVLAGLLSFYPNPRLYARGLWETLMSD
jgi:hypothetical protein